MKKLCLFTMLTVGLFAFSVSVHAQSLKDLLTKENLSSLLNNSAGGEANKDFTGTWTYKGSAIGFKTDDLLKKAGGAVAAATIKKKMDEQLEKYGVKPGMLDITFNADGVFTCVLNKKAMRGTYTYNSSTSTANFIFAGFFSLDAAVKYSSTKMTLMFDADKILLLLNYFSSQSNNATLKAIAELASQYEGMLVGLEVQKK